MAPFSINHIHVYPHHKMFEGYIGITLLNVSVCQSVCLCSMNSIVSEGSSVNLSQNIISIRYCEEPILPLFQLKVKATFEGQVHWWEYESYSAIHVVFFFSIFYKLL